MKLKYLLLLGGLTFGIGKLLASIDPATLSKESTGSSHNGKLRKRKLNTAKKKIHSASHK